MDNIIHLADVCFFNDARNLLRKEFEDIDDLKKGWEIKINTVYLHIKEKEKCLSLSKRDVHESIEKLISILQEIQAFPCSKDVFGVQITILSMVFALWNSANIDDAQKKNQLLRRYCKSLLEGVHLFWTDTGRLPSCPKNTNIEVTNDVLVYITKDLNTMIQRNKEYPLNLKMGNLLSNVFLFLIRTDSTKGEALPSHTLEALHRCVKNLQNIDDLNRDGRRNSNVFNFASKHDLKERSDSLNSIYSLFYESNGTSFYSETDTQGDGNVFNLLLKAIYLLQQEKYDVCVSHMNAILQCTVLYSKFSHFQYALAKNVQLIASQKCSLDACQDDENHMEFPTTSCKMVWHLNQATVACFQRSNEDCHKHLSKALKVSSENNGSVPYILVSNYEHQLDCVLQHLLIQRYPYITCANSWRLYLHVNEIPENYIRWQLAFELFFLKRYEEALVHYEKLRLNRVCTKGDLDINVEECIQRIILCRLKCNRLQQVENLLQEMKDDAFVVPEWFYIYAAEVQRRSKDFDEALTLLEKAFNKCEFSKNRQGDRKTRTYLKCHVLNNLCVVYMDMGRHMNAFHYMKEAISYCQQNKVKIFGELVYNYCKWLADNKSRDIAVINWNEFYSNGTVKFNVDDEYKIYL